MAKRKQSTFERLKNGTLNRKQRKQIMRRLSSDDPGLEIVHRHVAGIDVGNESHFVAVAPGDDAQPVREFGSWTEDLHKMVEWLKACGIQHVVMQSTGVYWIAVYDVLEKAGFQVCLANARDTRNLPGRKSDVQESQWLLKLHTYGLLRNSFRPPEEIRMVRTIWRLRTRLVQDAAREIRHMQKALTTMNVQLSNAISDISGTTGLAIIRAILQGQRDPFQLAKLKDYRIRAGEEEIARSLEGRQFQPGNKVVLGLPLTHIGSRFRDEGGDGHHIHSVDAPQIDPADSRELCLQVELWLVSPALLPALLPAFLLLLL